MRPFLLSTSSAFAVVTSFALTPRAANADVIVDYSAAWSGAAFSNDASATGTVQIDITTTTVLNATVTVTGAGVGDGTFTGISDVTGAWEGWVLNFDGGLGSYLGQLVGEKTGNGNIWGVTGGDLYPDPNFAVAGNAPEGEANFLLFTDGGEGSELKLTSLVSVPEPASAAVLAVGLAGLVRLRQRKRGKATH